MDVGEGRIILAWRPRPRKERSLHRRAQDRRRRRQDLRRLLRGERPGRAQPSWLGRGGARPIAFPSWQLADEQFGRGLASEDAHPAARGGGGRGRGGDQFHPPADLIIDRDIELVLRVARAGGERERRRGRRGKVRPRVAQLELWPHRRVVALLNLRDQAAAPDAVGRIPIDPDPDPPPIPPPPCPPPAPCPPPP